MSKLAGCTSIRCLPNDLSYDYPNPNPNQAVVYCLMLGAHAADLVQCVRGGERNGASKIHVTRIELGMPHRPRTLD